MGYWGWYLWSWDSSWFNNMGTICKKINWMLESSQLIHYYLKGKKVFGVRTFCRLQGYRPVPSVQNHVSYRGHRGRRGWPWRLVLVGLNQNLQRIGQQRPGHVHGREDKKLPFTTISHILLKQTAPNGQASTSLLMRDSNQDRIALLLWIKGDVARPWSCKVEIIEAMSIIIIKINNQIRVR